MDLAGLSDEDLHKSASLIGEVIERTAEANRKWQEVSEAVELERSPFFVPPWKSRWAGAARACCALQVHVGSRFYQCVHCNTFISRGMPRWQVHEMFGAPPPLGQDHYNRDEHAYG